MFLRSHVFASFRVTICRLLMSSNTMCDMVCSLTPSPRRVPASSLQVRSACSTRTIPCTHVLGLAGMCVFGVEIIIGFSCGLVVNGKMRTVQTTKQRVLSSLREQMFCDTRVFTDVAATRNLMRFFCTPANRNVSGINHQAKTTMLDN